MTAQIGEKLYYDGIKYSMAAEPLDQYLENNKIEQEKYSRCSACWRGYLGTWKIQDDKLYLIELEEFGETGKNTLMNRV